MNINRDYLIILDVKSGEVDSPNIYYFNTDKNTSNLYVQMVIKETNIEATPIDNATNYSIKANILKPNMVGKIVEGDLVNEAKAIYEFKLPADCTDFSGNAKIEFEVYCTVDGVEEIATSFATKFKVYGSVLTEQNKYIEDSSDYPILKELIEEVRELQANGGGGTGTGTSGHTHSNKSVLDGITSTRVTHWDTAYNHSQSHHFSGDYNDLTNKPTIPTKTSELTNDSDFATNTSVDVKIANIDTSKIIDLTDYQTKTDNTLKTTDKTIIGAINELYDMIVAIIGGETNGIVSSSYDYATGNLVLTATNGATITYNKTTGNLSISNSSTTYDSATGNLNIQ